MNNKSDDIPDIRAGILLQKYFEGVLSMTEAEELAFFWNTSSEFRSFALKNQEINHLLSFYSSLEAHPLSTEVRQHGEKKIIRFQPIDSPYGDDLPDDLPFEPLQEDMIDRLISEVIASTKEAEKESEFFSLEQRKSSNLPSPLSRRSSALPSRIHPAFNIGLILVCMAFFILAVVMEFSPRNPSDSKTPPPVPIFARVTRVVDPVFPEDGPSFRPGQQVGRETIELSSGRLELSLNNGVRIVLEGPVLFDLRSPKKTFCRLGRLSAEVPPEAKGFEVQTPLMNIRDLGTAFVVEVTDEECAVHVVQGEVEVDRLSNQWVPFTEGNGLVTRQGNNAFHQILARAGLFISGLQMKQAAESYEDRCYSEWKRYRDRWKNASETLVFVDFDENASWSEFVKKTKATSVAGRWPSGKAVSFSGKSDHVRLSTARTPREPLTSFTLFSVVRLNSLRHPNNVLFSVGDSEPGALHWQVNQSGSLQLLLGEEDGEGLMSYASPASTLTWSETEVWITLAVTVDHRTKTVTHYVDGNAVATLPLHTIREYCFSEMELGNWRRRERTPTDRHFNGQIDEFMLLGRAASPEEIASFTFVSQQQGEE